MSSRKTQELLANMLGVATEGVNEAAENCKRWTAFKQQGCIHGFGSPGMELRV